jgi:hypothetical protein
VSAWRTQVDRIWIGRFLIAPALIGALLALAVPAPNAWGTERMSAVLLLDGQAYFGHLREVPWSDTVELRDVYYFQDARATTEGLPLGLVRRGAELHQPLDGMQVRRDKILAIEQVGASSPVLAAIAAQRTLAGTPR